MEEIDVVRADNLEIGDCILFEGAICEIKEIVEAGDSIFFYSEDDREIDYEWHEFVPVYGYMDIDI